MTVEILRLSDLSVANAGQAAETLLDLRTGPARIDRLVVLDDTDALITHAPAYQRLATSRRIDKVLCVTVGSRAGGVRTLRLPGNLGGTQGNGVLWVGDPDGIDWRAAVSGIVSRHQGPSAKSGLDQLIEILTVESIFDRVHEAFEGGVPGRVASPGLRLAGADDEAATFPVALAAAISRVIDPAPEAARVFPALLPGAAGGASLAEGGPIVRHRDEVAESVEAADRALSKWAGLSGIFARSDDVTEHVVEVGVALIALRDLVVRLLQDASTTGEMTPNQRQLVAAVGVRFPDAPPRAALAGSGAEQSRVYRAVYDALRNGETLPLVSRRLALTGNEVRHHGSANFLPEAGQRCPRALLDQLTVPRLPPRHEGRAEARRELGLEAAMTAAQELLDLTVAAANREWSPVATAPGELARVRIAVDGVRKALAEHARGSAELLGLVPGARAGRLGESLMPILRDLVGQVVMGECAAPSAGGQEAFQAAYDRTLRLLAEWMERVQAHGVFAQPSFASSVVPGMPYVIEDDVAEVREALLYPPRQEMWQLCGPDDLGALNVTDPPLVVRFASRLTQEALAGVVPVADMAWTSSGSFAGLLRLVPLRPGITTWEWSGPDSWAVPGSSTVPEPS
jgi:hypothetical protein